MKLEKYSMGIGDRFGHQGKAQLSALITAKSEGIHVIPVWNKSNREHSIIGTVPADTRAEAEAATAAMGWTDAYYVDADHINLNNVTPFIACSDFFTLDVAEAIGKPCDKAALDKFVRRHSNLTGQLSFDGIEQTFDITEDIIRRIGSKYLFAVQEAGRIYRHLVSAKGQGNFITEISMDETDTPQTPLEMLFILAAAADEGIPVQTIAPKFTGRFNKGVDYVGDIEQFEKEFFANVAVIAYAIRQFGLPDNLKLSVHSGSDKFSIYEPIRRALKKFNCGLHLKTAGTTWLEELIGLATAGGDGLKIAKEVYAKAYAKMDDLCAPYATVIDIDKHMLPSPQEVYGWDGLTYAAALKHDPKCELYNPHLRQLLHVGYKIAAQMGNRYLDALAEYEDIVAACVKENILTRHIRRIFI
ncbi:MAG TPA: tagaturonate epimerase family protein [Anaerohalosphaeraceae bacterium]|nr:tagaturonate epimerase family protein [Anaerohalosphaeraceae bacterium]HOL31624.1 tagaturonate epimerase family protein [Anaerohalosphaeraceae bacterium]HOM75914.1 tagaturonate epimerase family protein [Anaerohalosphaeraceae bacterium]HPC63715.1 tagaturonate epimerase family protein [Anaerohalosphaeraceae bacterium]HPO69017.1 tagaturonate epimerase family protein [Anaerohalosphaeraceae bacterium]